MKITKGEHCLFFKQCVFDYMVVTFFDIIRVISNYIFRHSNISN
jgi:hypothetical protein